MALANTNARYGAVSKTLHWLMALVIVSLFVLGFAATQMAHELEAGHVAADQTDAYIARTIWMFSLHKTLGVLMFFTALARIVWTLSQPHPGLLNADHVLEALAAKAVHWVLYAAMLIMPLSGWVHHAATTGYAPIWWPFGQGLPFVAKSVAVADAATAVHWVSAWVMLGALGLHIAGALKHHIVDRDATLRRMLPGAVALPAIPAQRRSVGAPIAALAIWAAAIGAGLWLATPQVPTAAQVAENVAQSDVAAPRPVDANWQVTDGSLAIAITQNGQRVDGSFADWDAVIRFEPRDTDGVAGDVEVSIDIASLKLGTVTKQAMGADYFDSAQFATAQFTADILRAGDGYTAQGELTIKGVSVPMELVMDLQIQGNDTATLLAQSSVNRMDFGVGAGMTDTATLADAVEINVSLNAERIAEGS